MFPYLTTISSSTPSETINQTSSNSENHSGSIDLVTQTALIAIGFIAIFFISRQASIQSTYKSIASKGSEYKKSLNKTKNFYINSFIIKHNIAIWEKLLKQEQELKPKDILSTTVHTREASRTLIHELFTEHLSTPNGSILEIGSNLKSEHSYLASLLDSKFSSRLTYVDATQLSKSIKKTSLAHIVSVNVIDKISKNHLSDVVEESYQALHENGKIVILSKQHFDPKAMLEKHSTEDHFAFPYFDGTLMGLRFISKKLLLESSEQYSEQFKNFVNDFINTPQDKQLNFLMRQLKTNINFNAILETLCDSEAYTTVNPELSYLNDLMQAFTSHGGFEIIKNGYEKRTIVLSNPNYGSSQLEPNQLRLTSVFHVFIAQKTRT